MSLGCVRSCNILKIKQKKIFSKKKKKNVIQCGKGKKKNYFCNPKRRRHGVSEKRENEGVGVEGKQFIERMKGCSKYSRQLI